MEYKVLVHLYVPEIEEIYELYIPVNKTVGEILALLGQMVTELSKVYPDKGTRNLYNRRSDIVYPRNQLIRDTDIRNGTELVLFAE